MEVITAREGPSRLNTWLLYHVVGKPRYATVRQCHDMIMACHNISESRGASATAATVCRQGNKLP